WRISKANIKGESLASAAYGASVKQEHEDSGWDVVRVVELVKKNVPKHIADSYMGDIESAQRIVEQILRAREEFMKEQDRVSGLVRGRLDIDMPIILEACHCGEDLSRRYWGRWVIKHGDPMFNAVLNKTSHLAWKLWNNKETSQDRMNIILLKCQVPPSTTEELASSS
ncbi:NBS-containing resistance-like protein, partial [Trifolium medium]|nr:NBS-containing resistance-like protein [Trifolium medium]